MQAKAWLFERTFDLAIEHGNTRDATAWMPGKVLGIVNLAISKHLRTESPPFLGSLLRFVRGIIGRGTSDWEGTSCGNGKISLLSEIDGAVLKLRAVVGRNISGINAHFAPNLL